jgi:hypothetical protein
MNKVFSGVNKLLLWSLVLICASCSTYFLSSPVSHNESSLYCSLIHIPENTLVPYEKKKYLGIMMESVDRENSFIDECSTFIQIVTVMDESPADKAGLRKNDIILSANGTAVCKKNEDILRGFKQFIKSQRDNSRITLDILRDEEKLSLTALLIERPIQKQEEAIHEYFERCPDPHSSFNEELQAQENLLLFHRIRSDLDYHSNFIHNPQWLSKNLANPYQLKEFTYMLRHPLQSGAVAQDITKQIIHISNQGREMLDVVNSLSLLIDMNSTSTECNDISFPSLIATISAAHDNINNALSSLSPEERSLLREKAIEPWNDESWNNILKLSFKLEMQELLNAFHPLLSCLSYENITLLRKDLAERFENSDSPVLYETETTFGKVIVGGSVSNTYKEDAALILDIGGNDVYLNNAGGTRGNIPVSILIDWEGDDSYMTKERFSQGAGVLGGGFLIDLDGNDIFQALDGSQGTGLFGIGVLFNDGEDSVFKARNYCQGVGQFGIGILWSKGIENLYHCLENGQAVGFFQGAGMLLDENGNDYYLLGGRSPDFRDPSHSTVSMGQGFGKGIRLSENQDGISGGAGILIDKNGDDYYIADYFAQGSSYYFGIGILHDISGNDQYIAGRYAQGAGLNLYVGVLLDFFRTKMVMIHIYPEPYHKVLQL